MRAAVEDIKRRTIKMTVLGALFVTLIAGFVAGCILSRANRCMAGSNDSKYFTNITVEKGDTLWNIAEKYNDEDHYSSIYDYMNELRKMNNLTSDELYAGQSLVITYYVSDSDRNELVSGSTISVSDR
ncbi:MAG: LysM peptidoglycan-binding domain-containing protein [Butyrivibrio sp.]